MTKDLTTGPAIPLILSFSIPVMLGNLFQQFYNLVDTIIVGRFLGVSELAAVGSTGAVNFLIIGFVSGLCGGMGVPIAQRFGAKDETGLRRYVANAFYVAILFSLIMTPLMVIMTRQILVVMQTPADILDNACAYIGIIFAGIPLIFLYNLVASVIRALGDSKTPLYFLIFASFINIGLDLITILVFGMGVEGPALATVTSQGLSGILCYLYMKKKFPVLRMEKEERRVSVGAMGRLVGMGAPMGLQYSITAIGSVVLQSAVNTLGSGAVAAVTAASKVNMFGANCILDSLGAAMATYSGQNLGAGKYDRILDGVKKTLFLGLSYSVIACIGMHLFSGAMLRLFVSNGSQMEVLVRGREWCICNSYFYWALAILAVLRFSIQGLGHSMIAILAGVAEMVARCVIAFFFVESFGFRAVCFANPLAWLAAAVVLIPSFCMVMKKVRRQLGME